MHSIRTLSVLSAIIAAASAQCSSSGTYTSYHGDGSTEAGWPAESAWWDSFDDMWNANYCYVTNSCFYPDTTDTTADEASDIQAAILDYASQSGVDSRLILAVVMQETKGCVRAWETNNGVQNTGIMQSYNGTGTCNTSVGKDGSLVSQGVVTTPCPQATIYQMISDGTVGTTGPGLEQDLTTAGSSQYGAGEPAQLAYRAVRIYNSGGIAKDSNGDYDLSLADGATASYASDIANRISQGIVFDNSNFS